MPYVNVSEWDFNESQLEMGKEPGQKFGNWPHVATLTPDINMLKGNDNC